MFCDQCGTQFGPGQLYCSRCGKKFVGSMSQVPPARVREHIHLLSILWMAFSALTAIGGAVVLIVANTIFARAGWIFGRELPPNAHPAFLHPLLTFVAILVLLKAAVGFLAGWGLMQRQPWARILALVVGFVSLFNIPLGTALGIYTMWVLLPAESETEYGRMGQSLAA